MSFYKFNEDVIASIAEAVSEDFANFYSPDLTDSYLQMGKLYIKAEKQDLASLSVVLGNTSTAATRWLYRDVKLNFSGAEVPWTYSVLKILHEKPEYRSFVHNLRVIIEPSLFNIDGGT